MSDSVSAFVNAACVPVDSDHAGGDLTEAEALLATHPDIANASIVTAAILGHDQMVMKFLEGNDGVASTKAPPRDWDPLTYVCFSRYLRLDKSRSTAFVRTVRVLLDAGADPNTGWFEKQHQPRAVFESAIYGAAGVARNADVTRLLLERGADPNDEETPYHVPETYDNSVLGVLIESGKLNTDSLSTLLLRKTDWHDCDGVRMLLTAGADPKRMTQWGKTAIQNATLRDNDISILELLLDHGADPLIVSHKSSSDTGLAMSAVQVAGQRGRGDVLELFQRRGISIFTSGVDALLVACAMDDKAAIDELVADEPSLVGNVLENGGKYLADFAGNGNANGLERLLNLGVPVDARSMHGDGYFGLPPMSTALHSAAWRARPAVVKLLIARGADINATTLTGVTPLQFALKAAVDSYWKGRRTTESIQALLGAGASLEGIQVPTGYDEADELFRRYTSAKQPRH